MNVKLKANLILLTIVSVVIVGSCIFSGGASRQNEPAKSSGMEIWDKKKALRDLTTPIEDYSRIPDFFVDERTISSFVLLIKANGNSCNSISSISAPSVNTFNVECNNSQYEYQFKDIGGKLDYKVIR